MSQSQAKPLRVIHVLGSADIGGIEILTAELIQVLHSDERGPEMGVIFSQSSDGPMAGLFESAGVEMTSLALSSGYDLSPGKYRIARALMRNFDVVHMHSFNPLVAAAAVSSGASIVYTEHGNFGFGRRQSWTDRIKSALRKWFLNNKVQYITFNSKFTSNTAIRRYGLATVEKSVIYNGLLLEKPSSRALVGKELEEWVKGKLVVGTTARFAGFKRIDRLIAGFSLFAANKSEVALLLVGDGELRGELEAQVANLGLAGKVQFTGYQAHATAFQKHMDVCVFPSENEPFGLVAMEAYALGKPVVVFADSGGFLETVGEFSPKDVVGDETELAARLQFYYDHPDAVARGSERRVRRARQFDITKMAKEFLRVYEAVA